LVRGKKKEKKGPACIFSDISEKEGKKRRRKELSNLSSLSVAGNRRGRENRRRG